MLALERYGDSEGPGMWLDTGRDPADSDGAIASADRSMPFRLSLRASGSARSELCRFSVLS